MQSSNISGVEVKLTLPELLNASTVGAIRHHESVQSGRKDAHGFSDQNSGIAIHIEGAAGEIAAARVWGLYFSGHVNSFKGADLGERTQVRTRSQHNYDLIVRKDDADDHIYILVTGTAPHYFVRGWLLGRDAKKPEYIRDHGNRPNAYFVPACDLHPMDSLPE